MKPVALPGVGAVVVAAGRGQRLGGELPKALVTLSGRSLVARAVDAVLAAEITEVVVVHPPDAEAAFVAELADHAVTLVPGGATRTASVRAGIAALAPDTERVAIHDAARALQPAAVVRAAVDAVAGDVLAVAPSLPVTDTIKRVDGQRVVATVDRSDLVAVQTPQVFVAAALRAAHEAGDEATDDLALIERLIDRGVLAGTVHHVAGSALGLKVTGAADLVVAEALLADLGGER